jgi:hypothetical protein
MWFSHNPLLINATEEYGFDIAPQFNASDPSREETQAEYSDGMIYGTYVNEAQYIASAVDCTGITTSLNPVDSINAISSVCSNGRASFRFDFSEKLPTRCKICNDSRTLGEVNPSFTFRDTNGSYRTIKKGVALFRSTAPVGGSVSFDNGWDFCVDLEDFQNNSHLEYSFEPGLVVQVATLMEIDNYDTGFWIWQKHHYYHNIGIYCFRTTDL